MTAHAGLWIVTMGLLISLAGVGPVPFQEGSEKEAALQEIESLMEAGEWQKAIKAIKAYLRKHAETEEEKEEASGRLTEAEASLELEEIEAEYRKKPRPRRAVQKLDRFVGEYADLDEYPDLDKLRERAVELRDILRSEYVLIVEDFENWEGISEEDRPRMSQVSVPRLVRHGRSSCRWRAGIGWEECWLKNPLEDWSEYDLFCLWVYNEKKADRPGQIRIEPVSAEDHYYSFLLTVDWTGWREIRMPLTGKKSRFSRRGRPDWKMIESLGLFHSSLSSRSAEIIIDDIRLEKAVK